jgi:hypothetical protein
MDCVKMVPYKSKHVATIRDLQLNYIFMFDSVITLLLLYQRERDWLYKNINVSRMTDKK